ncbi:MAG: hypothetical protein R3C56_30930 [Pirellulaceae bacterium]
MFGLCWLGQHPQRLVGVGRENYLIEELCLTTDWLHDNAVLGADYKVHP